MGKLFFDPPPNRKITFLVATDFLHHFSPLEHSYK